METVKTYTTYNLGDKIPTIGSDALTAQLSRLLPQATVSVTEKSDGSTYIKAVFRQPGDSSSDAGAYHITIGDMGINVMKFEVAAPSLSGLTHRMLKEASNQLHSSFCVRMPSERTDKDMESIFSAADYIRRCYGDIETLLGNIDNRVKVTHQDYFM